MKKEEGAPQAEVSAFALPQMLIFFKYFTKMEPLFLKVLDMWILLFLTPFSSMRFRMPGGKSSRALDWGLHVACQI